MPAESQGDVTALLRAWSRGDAEAGERLVPLVYAELRRQAARFLRRERSDHTLRPTALVHEAYLRLVGHRGTTWKSRAHFFAVAAKVMRRVLVDHARGHRAAKRAGSWVRVPLEQADAAATAGGGDVDVVALDQALSALAAFDPKRARIVELRFFGGLTLDETAEVVGASAATVTRDWRLARAWLYRWMMDGLE